jgi:hypothetical protein
MGNTVVKPSAFASSKVKLYAKSLLYFNFAFEIVGAVDDGQSKRILMLCASKEELISPKKIVKRVGFIVKLVC